MSEVVPEAVPATPAVPAAPAAATPEPAKAGTFLTSAEDDATPAEGKPKDAAPVVPEKYEFKAPSGVALDQEQTAQYAEVAKAAKLTQDQAQSLVDFDLKRSAAMSESLAAERRGWIDAVKNDKEIGGANYEQTRRLARAGFQKFADAELTDFMNVTGFGEHPALVRYCRLVALGFGEDKTQGLNSSAGQATGSFADEFYAKANKAYSANNSQ